MWSTRFDLLLHRKDLRLPEAQKTLQTRRLDLSLTTSGQLGRTFALRASPATTVFVRGLQAVSRAGSERDAEKPAVDCA